MPFLVIVPIGHLAWVFLGPIRIAAPIAIIRSINDINSKNLGRAFNFLFLVLVVAVLLFLLFGLGNRFKEPRVGRLRILVSRFRDLDPWISYWGSLRKVFGIFGRLLVIDNLLVYLSEY